MTRTEIFNELLKLSPEERLQIVHDLWDSLDEDDVPLTKEQEAELDRRMQEHERDPSTAIPWEVVRDRLRAQFG